MIKQNKHRKHNSTVRVFANLLTVAYKNKTGLRQQRLGKSRSLLPERFFMLFAYKLNIWIKSFLEFTVLPK